MKTPDKRIPLFNTSTSDYIDNFRDKLSKLAIPKEEVNRILQRFIFNINSKPNDALLTPIFAEINETVDTESFNFMLEQIIYNLKGLFLDSYSLDRYLESTVTIYSNEINKLEALNLSLQKDLTKLEFLNDDILGFTDSSFNDFSSAPVNNNFTLIQGVGLALKTISSQTLKFHDVRVNSILTSKGDIDLNDQIKPISGSGRLRRESSIINNSELVFSYIVSTEKPLNDGAELAINLEFLVSTEFNFLKIKTPTSSIVKEVIINEISIDFEAPNKSQEFEIYLGSQFSKKVTIVFLDNEASLSGQSRSGGYFTKVFTSEKNKEILFSNIQLNNYIFSIKEISAVKKVFSKEKLKLDLDIVAGNVGQIAVEDSVIMAEVPILGIFNASIPSASLEYNLSVKRTLPKVDNPIYPTLPLRASLVEDEVLSFTLVNNKVLAVLRFRYHDVSYSPETYLSNYTNIKIYRDGSLLKAGQDWNFFDLPSLSSVITSNSDNNIYTKLGQTVIQLNIDTNSYQNKLYTCTYIPFHVSNKNSTIHMSVVPNKNTLYNIGFFDSQESYFIYERDTIISSENIIEFRNPLVSISEILPILFVQNTSNSTIISPIIKNIVVMSSTKDKLKFLNL